MQECPFCHEQVHPERNEAGQLVCPECQNQGASDVRDAGTADYATPSMVLGIIALPIPAFGLILGVLAVAFSMRAERRLMVDPKLAGHRRSAAGLSMGIVAIGVHAAIVLMIIANAWLEAS